MPLHQNLPILLPVGLISIILGISSSASVSSRLQPSPSAMSTPYRNDHPVIYMSAFYDPKYHSISQITPEDDGRGSKTIPTESAKIIAEKQSSPTVRTFTREEKAAIRLKYQMLQNAKLFKRGIANSVDFAGAGDSLAVESRDSLAMESEGTPRIVVKGKITSESHSVVQNNKNNNKDQIQAESGKKVVTNAIPNSGSKFNPHAPQSYYDAGGLSVGQQDVLSSYIDELTHGRRKMRAHYFRKHKTPSLGKAFVHVKSRIGYW